MLQHGFPTCLLLIYVVKYVLKKSMETRRSTSFSFVCITVNLTWQGKDCVPPLYF